MALGLQRFLISGGKLANRCRVLPVYALFRASILDFRLKLENRCRVFLVYALLRASILDFRARLENRCKVFPVYALFRASILDFKLRLANRCKRRMVSSAAAVATTRSVSDSNLRSCKEEWPACRGRRDNDLPRLILIFVAAKKNGPPAAAVAATIFRI